MRATFLFLLLSILFGHTSYSQKQLNVSTYDLGTAVPREAGDNETVVIIKTPSIMALTFESTMDKAVDVYDTKEESGFNLYYLKFSTLPKYKGRKLKIRCDNYETETYPLELVAKVPLGLYVIDPDGTVGVTCYLEHRNKGNALFSQCLYADAKVEYFLALECSDVPEDNDLSKKIEDSDFCDEYKRKADNLYGGQLWEEAKREYEKVTGINAADQHCLARIELCNEEIGNLPRTITGVVTNQAGSPLEGVTIKAEYVKVDKNGKIQYNKNGFPEKEFKTVGKTDAEGKYAIVVLNKSKMLEFVKGKIIDKERYGAKFPIANDVMNIALEAKFKLGDISTVITEGANVVTEGSKAVDEVSKAFK